MVSVFDLERGVFIMYGFLDNILKFWDEKMGLLYRMIDF